MVAKIGLMGGTFDPIHYGHLLAAEVARWTFALDKIIFIPAAVPPHKADRKKITSASCRLAMTGQAIASNPHFYLSDLELKRQGPSYTVDTVREIKRLYPQNQIYFITGADAIMEILTWNRVEELMSLAYFITATRPGFKLERLWDYLQNFPWKERVQIMEIPGLAISSTEIRQRVQAGQPVKYLVPEAVENYIYQQKLYQDLSE